MLNLGVKMNYFCKKDCVCENHHMLRKGHFYKITFTMLPECIIELLGHYKGGTS